MERDADGDRRHRMDRLPPRIFNSGHAIAA
jgi:hypothetical protein